MKYKDTSDIMKGIVAAWNRGDVPELLGWFAPDIAYCSPLAGDQPEESRWLQGSQEVAIHLLALRNRFEQLEFGDILYGAGFQTLLLKHNRGNISILIEPTDDCKARRIIICHSGPELAAAEG